MAEEFGLADRGGYYFCLNDIVIVTAQQKAMRSHGLTLRLLSGFS